jgi:hypothetical protein
LLSRITAWRISFVVIGDTVCADTNFIGSVETGEITTNTHDFKHNFNSVARLLMKIQ